MCIQTQEPASDHRYCKGMRGNFLRFSPSSFVAFLSLQWLAAHKGSLCTREASVVWCTCLPSLFLRQLFRLLKIPSHNLADMQALGLYVGGILLLLLFCVSVCVGHLCWLLIPFYSLKTNSLVIWHGSLGRDAGGMWGKNSGDRDKHFNKICFQKCKKKKKKDY